MYFSGWVTPICNVEDIIKDADAEREVQPSVMLSFAHLHDIARHHCVVHHFEKHINASKRKK